MPRPVGARRSSSSAAPSPAVTREAPPRYAPERSFPSYAYITGIAPHPRRDPRGHSYGVPEIAPPPLNPSQPLASEDFLHGIDLFNHGYYWEAHEAWEGLWRVSRARGEHATTQFLQALIKLAAAGFKVRQGRPEGVRRHASRAAELLAAVRGSMGSARWAGLSIGTLLAFARRVSEHPPKRPAVVGAGPMPVPGFRLRIDPR
jgi:hypothetical protein